MVPREAKCLQLDILTEEECVHLIMSELAEVSEEDASKLADKLQRLPLAIQQAIAYIKDQYLEGSDYVSKYISELNTSAQKLLNDERFQNTNDYFLTTFTTWQITLDRIKDIEDGELAIRVMNVLAYLNPDNISAEFLLNLFRAGQSEVDTGTNAERGLKLIGKYSMLKMEKGKVHIHRLVQQVVRLNSGSQELHILDQILEFIAKCLSVHKLTEFNRECMSHGLHLFPFQFNHAELMQCKSPCLSDLCYYLVEYGNYAECLSIATGIFQVRGD
jgi:hypothetical protein